jgi:hypothetical protein
MKHPIWLLAAAAGATLLAMSAPALADKIKHPTAVFAGLDKITGRIISFEAAMGETVQFGTLQITPRVCYSRPPTEAPQTDAFAEVDEVLENKSTHRIFGGWMFADSPGMHGVEHPVYDIWLTDCKGGTEIIHEAPAVADAPAPDSPDSDPTAASPDAKGKPPAVAPGVLPTPAATPKKRKTNAAAAPASPNTLDFGLPPIAPPGPAVVAAPPAAPPAATARNPPALRTAPSDDAPIPPADIGR